MRYLLLIISIFVCDPLSAGCIGFSRYIQNPCYPFKNFEISDSYSTAYVLCRQSSYCNLVDYPQETAAFYHILPGPLAWRAFETLIYHGNSENNDILKIFNWGKCRNNENYWIDIGYVIGNSQRNDHRNLYNEGKYFIEREINGEIYPFIKVKNRAWIKGQNNPQYKNEYTQNWANELYLWDFEIGKWDLMYAYEYRIVKNGIVNEDTLEIDTRDDGGKYNQAYDITCRTSWIETFWKYEDAFGNPYRGSFQCLDSFEDDIGEEYQKVIPPLEAIGIQLMTTKYKRKKLGYQVPLNYDKNYLTAKVDSQKSNGDGFTVISENNKGWVVNHEGKRWGHE